MKYYSQYRIHDLFELQESLWIEQVQPLGQACRPPSLGQDRKRIQQASEEQPLRSRQQAHPHGCWCLNCEACGEFEQRQARRGEKKGPM